MAAINVERQLRTSESRYRSLFENMREGVAIQELVEVDGAVSDYRGRRPRAPYQF